MENEKIINMHTHIFPAKIAEKAVSAIGDFYDLHMATGGTSESLIADGAPFGVYKYLVSSTATTEHQVMSINTFIAQECEKHPEFVGFGSLHPGLTREETFAEVERIISLGLKGVKLHPDFQKFNIDDPIAFNIYEAVEGKLPILFHIGDNRYDYSSPIRLHNVLEKFPKLVAIAAHLGGYRRWEDSHINMSHPRVYIDTCSSIEFMSPEEAVSIIRSHGVDRVFFGTDSPMWSHAETMERFNKLPLTAEEREMILYKNAQRCLEQGF